MCPCTHRDAYMRAHARESYVYTCAPSFANTNLLPACDTHTHTNKVAEKWLRDELAEQKANNEQREAASGDGAVHAKVGGG